MIDSITGCITFVLNDSQVDEERIRHVCGSDRSVGRSADDIKRSSLCCRLILLFCLRPMIESRLCFLVILHQRRVAFSLGLDMGGWDDGVNHADCQTWKQTTCSNTRPSFSRKRKIFITYLSLLYSFIACVIQQQWRNFYQTECYQEKNRQTWCHSASAVFWLRVQWSFIFVWGKKI